MSVTDILKNKKQKKDLLLNKYNLKDNKKALGLLILKEDLIDDILTDALKILPANFVIITQKENKKFDNISFEKWSIQNWGFDFIVCDECEENLMKFFKDWVVPVIYKKHHISSLLSEFDAKKIEWNAFLFENNELCDIYYAIIRFIENYKFPYDHKALVKNVLDV